MAASSARATGRTGAARAAPARTLRGRLLAAGLSLLSAVLGRLPDAPLHRLAQAGGGLLYRLQPARRELVRANLQRVCRYLAANRLVEPGSAAALAAGDDRALDRLVRTAFGHYLRGYLEVAIVGAYARGGEAQRIVADDPDLVEQAFGREGQASGPLIVIGMHFGALEVPGLWTSRQGLCVTAPMETAPDPDLHAYLSRSRAAAGVRIVAPAGAGRALTAALARGEVVALVADRVVAGAGARVELFGAETRLPLGPAALALESGAPAWLITTRRAGWGRYRAHLERIELPVADARRERLGGFLANQARAFERAVAQAPEQWWTVFFPIWRASESPD
jgi:phosphatidylinositol dimannoside acyltransferase